MRKRLAHEQALWYEEELQKEIAKDWEVYGKKSLKKKDKNEPPSSGGTVDREKEKEIPKGVKTQKCSITDPESGWFQKGEHKHVFAYAVETACDKHGWILGYSVHPGNEHDSRTFKRLYDKIKNYSPSMIVSDAEYHTPAIAHKLLKDGIKLLFPYKRPMTKDGFYRKYELNMMSFMTATFAQKIIYCLAIPQTEKGTGNTGVVEKHVPSVAAFTNARKVKNIEK